VGQTHARPTPTIKVPIVCVGLSYAKESYFDHSWAKPMQSPSKSEKMVEFSSFESSWLAKTF